MSGAEATLINVKCWPMDLTGQALQGMPLRPISPGSLRRQGSTASGGTSRVPPAYRDADREGIVILVAVPVIMFTAPLPAGGAGIETQSSCEIVLARS